jgi:NADP-dependent aldehyde dehydrogenase
MLAGDLTEKFIADVKQRFESRTPAPLLGSPVLKSLGASVGTLIEAGAKLVTGGKPIEGACKFNNTLLRVDAEQFLKKPHQLQTEAFGNVSLVVVARDLPQAQAVIEQLEGNLTGCIYTSTTAEDDASYDALAPTLRLRVGRLLNDKMPTGVAVSPAMNHGGPYPATGHPGFTAVGIPASLHRFAVLQCFDNVRQHRLPLPLRDRNPSGKMWRLIDGTWARDDVASS